MSEPRLSLITAVAAALAITGCGGSGPSSSAARTTGSAAGSSTARASSSAAPAGSSAAPAGSSPAPPASSSATAAGSSTTIAPSSSSPSATTATAAGDRGGFRTSFVRDRRRLHLLGLQLASQLRRAPHETDLALSARFRTLSTRLLALSSDMASLHPPARDRGEVAKLAASLGAVGQDVGQISRAATRHDAPLARVATVKLVQHSLQVRAFETRLSHRLSLGAP